MIVKKITSIFLIVIFLVFTDCGTEKSQKKNTENVAEEGDILEVRPNIILIMTDDQGWGDVAYNQHPYIKTPNIDAMMANGARFNRFYAGSAVCSPTRGSVMTGRNPMRYGICYANCGHIKAEEITLGEMAKGQGYTTGHFGKWHLGTLTKNTLDANRGGRPENDEHYAPPWENGFDECFVTESKVPTWNPMVTPDSAAEDVNASLKEGDYFGTSYWTGPGEIATENLQGDDSRIIMDRAIPFIEQAVNDKKQFLSVIWFHTPHLPVLTSAENREMYASLSEDQQHYYGVITAMDLQVGRLRNKLKDLGISDNTVLFFTSDNGPEGKSVSGRTQGITKGLKGRKRSLYEGGIRVPGIMEWPRKIKAGATVNAPCFTSDYFPTIAKLLDVDIEKYQRPFDGIDILPFVLRSSDKRAEHLVFTIEEQVAVIEGDYKIYSSNNGKTFELYNLLEDPGEKSNIAMVETDRLNEMVAYWEKWQTSQNASANGEDYKNY